MFCEVANYNTIVADGSEYFLVLSKADPDNLRAKYCRAILLFRVLVAVRQLVLFQPHHGAARAFCPFLTHTLP